MSDMVLQRLESYVRQARVILFLGAGFSLDAQNRAGEAIPGVGTITQKLWELAFPGEPYDDSSLQDVYEAALLQARRPVIDLMRSAFTVAPATLPDYYGLWFSLPWHRVYTLNVDDLAEAADQAFELPRAIEPVSALTSPISPSSPDRLQVVHLNGRLEDLPDVTFSDRQYAERLAKADVWYANLSRELVAHPVLYVGTSLDEPTLWQYVETRGPRPSGSELRPGSILVTKALAKARQVALRRYNVEWIEGTAKSFAEDTLSGLGDAAATGLETLKRANPGREAVLLDLAHVVDDSVDDEREFLMGREPRWSDFTERGFAAAREFDRELASRVTTERPNLVVLTGTAGAGKSSSARRLVLGLREEGKSVVLLNEDADLRGHLIRIAVDATDADVLFIEDFERLGQGALRVLDDIQESKPSMLVVGTVRSPRFDRLGFSAYLEERNDAFDAVVPLLADPDIDALLDTLDRANRLGALKGKPRGHQRETLAAKCGRQLLVAMIEATSGQRFDARIESECRDLSPASALVYSVVALATAFRIRIDRPMLLAALGENPVEQMRSISELERTHLLILDSDGRVALRHRVIADRAVEFFRAQRMIETPLRGLAFALATSAQPGQLRASREGQALIRLINHDKLIEFLRTADGADTDLVAIRGLYQELEPLLRQDHHFWLQRGSFETEAGDVDRAKNFIEQARSLAPDDPYVRTQWAYMTLKRASRRPGDPTSAESVDEAFSELADVIEARGRRDSYPFHVYGSQGLAWAKRAGLAADDKERLLLGLRRVVERGIGLHRTNIELQQLSKDLEHEYLLLATS